MKTNIRVTLATTFIPSMDRFRLARMRLKELKDYAWDLRDVGTDLVQGEAQTMKFLPWNGLRICYVYRSATDEVVLLRIEKDVPPPPPPPAVARNRPQRKPSRNRILQNIANVLVRLLSRWIGQFNDLSSRRASFRSQSLAVTRSAILSKGTDTARLETRVIGRTWFELRKINHGDKRPVLNLRRYLTMLPSAPKAGNDSPETYELIHWSKVPNMREHRFALLRLIGLLEDNLPSFLPLIAGANEIKCESLMLGAGDERVSAIFKSEYLQRAFSVFGIGHSAKASTFREITYGLREYCLHLRSSFVRLVRKARLEFDLAAVRRQLEQTFPKAFALRWIERQYEVHLTLR